MAQTQTVYFSEDTLRAMLLHRLTLHNGSGMMDGLSIAALKVEQDDDGRIVLRLDMHEISQLPKLRAEVAAARARSTMPTESEPAPDDPAEDGVIETAQHLQ